MGDLGQVVSKTVKKYDADGNIMSVFPSVRECMRLDNISDSTIRRHNGKLIMININDFYLTTNKIMLGETLATQYIWTDENGNKVAEFKIWDWWDGINVSDLEVYGEYKGKGLSYQLLNYAVVKCGARNLAVRKTNSIAKHIYEKYGFEIVEQDDYMNYMTFKMYNMRGPNRIDE